MLYTHLLDSSNGTKRGLYPLFIVALRLHSLVSKELHSLAGIFCDVEYHEISD